MFQLNLDLRQGSPGFRLRINIISADSDILLPQELMMQMG